MNHRLYFAALILFTVLSFVFTHTALAAVNYSSPTSTTKYRTLHPTGKGDIYGLSAEQTMDAWFAASSLVECSRQPGAVSPGQNENWTVYYQKYGSCETVGGLTLTLWYEFPDMCSDPNFSTSVLGGAVCVPNQCGADSSNHSPAATDSAAREGSSLIGDLITGVVRFFANPISCSTGQKVESDVVYAGSGADPLSYVSYYASPKAPTTTSSPTPQQIWNEHNGFGRIGNHFKKLETIYAENGDQVLRINANNKAAHYFYKSQSDTEYTATQSKSGTLVVNPDGSYTQTRPNGNVYNYNADGLLVSRNLASGLTRKYVYTESGQLKTVTNHFGQSLQYFYDGNGRLEKLTDPDGRDYWFAYDGHDNLIKVTYPDTTPSDLTDNPYVEYLFENAGFPNHLTGKMNEKGVRFATWQYDTNGRAISSEHHNGLEKVELDYSIEEQVKVTHHLSATLSNQAILHYDDLLFGEDIERKLTSVENLACTDCVVGNWKYGYDDNGYIRDSTSPAGRVTQFTHDAQGFETQRISAYGTAAQKVLDTVWDTTNRRVTQTTRDNLQTAYVYNAANQLTSVTLTDLVSGETRTTTYTYNADGLISTLDGPRTDVSDVTTYSYDANGNVYTITNALNHVVTLEHYDASGRVGQVTDANGVITTMTYTMRGWLATTTANGLTTEYQYYPTGSLKKVITPAGQTLEYFYDDGERLTAVEDNAGNRMEYTLDLMGNITRSEIKDPQGVVKFSQTQVFNALGQLAKSLGNNGQFTESTYDADGEPVASNNAKNQTTSATLDAIKRVTKTLDAGQGETRFEYNQKDQITKVIDPENRETIYEYNHFGELTK
ncbi:MAG: hypothetical protein OQJ89_06060, partial [Kangiellaceae bacterium]|nr:hypothetical protein [Kangiellaceae bacterium]